jgi:hypothetical protein
MGILPMQVRDMGILPMPLHGRDARATSYHPMRHDATIAL